MKKSKKGSDKKKNDKVNKHKKSDVISESGFNKNEQYILKLLSDTLYIYDIDLKCNIEHNTEQKLQVFGDLTPSHESDNGKDIFKIILKTPGNTMMVEIGIDPDKISTTTIKDLVNILMITVVAKNVQDTIQIEKIKKEIFSIFMPVINTINNITTTNIIQSNITSSIKSINTFFK